MTKWGIPAAIKTGSARPGWGVTKPAPRRVGWGVQLNPYGNGASVTRGGALYQVDSPGQPWPSYTGAGGVDRFEVRAGDRWYHDHGTTERCELANILNQQPFDADVWLAFSFRFTGTITSPWHVLGQFRGTDDAADYPARSPVFAQEMYGPNTFRVVTRSDPTNPSSGNLTAITRYQDSAFAFGVWHSVVYKLRFARTGNGSLAAWVDGNVAVADAPIPLGYNDTAGPGWKYGIYRGVGGTTTSVCEYVNLELGTSSLAARVASPLPTP